MDSLDCTYLVISDHCLLSDDVYRLCMELGDNRNSRPACSGGLSSRRSTAPNFDVSECPGIRHRLALGEIGGSDFPYFPVGDAFAASNSKTDHSRFLSLSDSISYVVGDSHSWNTVLGMLVAIEKAANLLERCLTNRLNGPGMRVDLENGASVPDY